jgi:hypothetical protein
MACGADHAQHATITFRRAGPSLHFTLNVVVAGCVCTGGSGLAAHCGSRAPKQRQPAFMDRSGMLHLPEGRSDIRADSHRLMIVQGYSDR